MKNLKVGDNIRPKTDMSLCFWVREIKKDGYLITNGRGYKMLYESEYKYWEKIKN